MQTIFWNKVESGGQIILPPSGVAVLASVVDANGDSMIVRAIYAANQSLEKQGWYEISEHSKEDWLITDRVTHWMPLPPCPPKKELVKAAYNTALRHINA